MKLTDFISLNYNENNKIINELSNSFSLSNTNKQEQETIIFSLNEHSDKFEVNPNEKLQINYYSLRIIKSQNMLNLKQNIMGIITAKIINSSNEEKKLHYQLEKQCKFYKNMFYYLMKLLLMRIIV